MTPTHNTAEQAAEDARVRLERLRAVTLVEKNDPSSWTDSDKQLVRSEILRVMRNG